MEKLPLALNKLSCLKAKFEVNLKLLITLI